MTLEAARLGKCYDALETQLKATRASSGVLLAGGFSAADVSVGQAVYLGRKFRTLDQHPAVAAWFGHLEARDAFRASLPDKSEELYTRDFYPAWEMPT